MKSNTPFVVPDPPTLNTAVHITKLTCQHAADTPVFNEHLYVELALKKQLIDSTDLLFLEAAQEDQDVGLANKMVRGLLQHLVNEYVGYYSTWSMSMAISPAGPRTG
jgi:hypothetical protein